jgi:hypothetical protein
VTHARHEPRDRSPHALDVVRLHVRRRERRLLSAGCQLPLEIVQIRRHQHVVGAEAEPLVQPARGLVRQRDVERQVRDAAPAQAFARRSDELTADAAAAGLGVHVEVIEVTADRCLRDDRRERVADGRVVVLGDQRDAVRDRLSDVVGDRLPRLVEERRLAQLLLELVAQPVQELEVARLCVANRHA